MWGVRDAVRGEKRVGCGNEFSIIFPPSSIG